MCGPRESSCAILLRSKICIWKIMALSIRCIAAWGHLPRRQTLYCCQHGQIGGNAALGTDSSGGVRGSHLCIAFFVSVCPVVFPPPDGTCGGEAEYPTGTPDRAVQAGPSV